jgi:2'-hydroxyisoflavone reductase
MNVLVLGGTGFVGRHIVEWFVHQGHRVVVFHRGRTHAALPNGVEERLGDREKDLSILAAETWDGIVDTSGHRADQLERSLLLRTDRYLFVSTLNVYTNLSRAGVSEDAPTIQEFDTTDPAASYGGNKAACERLVSQCHPGTSVILRPGLVAGRWDSSGRFTYWCRRLLRGGDVLAPGDPRRRIQFIDAADLACFAEHALSNDVAGIFNVAGPAVPATMGQYLEACATVAAQRAAPPSRLVWAEEAFLHDQGVEEWTEMPLWVADPEFSGIMQASNAKALAAGLKTRPIVQTVRAVLEWLDSDPDAKSLGIPPEREAALLDAYARLKSTRGPICAT